MRSAEAGRRLEQLARELDLVVFGLELAARAERSSQPVDPTHLLRELAALRDRIESLSRELDPAE